MAWWYNSNNNPNSTDGAWDVDLKGKAEHRNRGYGLKVLVRGIISLICLILLYLGLTYFSTTLNVEEQSIYRYLFLPLQLILYILLFATLQVPIGLYYFIRYFRVENKG